MAVENKHTIQISRALRWYTSDTYTSVRLTAMPTVQQYGPYNV